MPSKDRLPARRPRLASFLSSATLVVSRLLLAAVTLVTLALTALPACTAGADETTDDPDAWPTSEKIALCDELFSTDPNGVGEEGRTETWTRCVTCGLTCEHPCRYTLSLPPTFSCDATW